ncbi:MAG TPA: 3'(2'),5'-bisphosphate nucleotidase CysQ [Candidatus Binataceae bacterium]|nr:3'(2'),5'-bisphosphate nucleotidase CysQ [Candidatus Binataceae bacterium]
MSKIENPRTVSTTTHEFARELKAAEAAALEAGEILRRHYRDRGFTIDQKGKDNPVTTADFEADHKLKELLHDGFPGYGWLSEETADDGARLRHDRVWIVDPLDGTKEFIKGIPEFVVAIALAEQGVPVVGVTYNPIRDELFAGARGAGVTLNGQPAAVTPRPSLDHATVLASRSETSRGEWKGYEHRIKIDPIGSVAYKLALVAAGRADATFTLTPKSEWDIASGAALVIEAGGRVTDLDGKAIRFNQASVKLKGFVASNGLLHDEIERMLLLSK